MLSIFTRYLAGGEINTCSFYHFKDRILHHPPKTKDTGGINLVALCLPVVLPVRTEFLQYWDREKLIDGASHFHAEQFNPTFLVWYLLIPLELKPLGRKLSDSTTLLFQLKPGKASNKHPLVIQVVQMKIRKT